jgi:prefoldin subunit 5
MPVQNGYMKEDLAMGENDAIDFIRESIREIKDSLQAVLIKMGEMSGMATTVSFLEKQVDEYRKAIKQQGDELILLKSKLENEIQKKIDGTRTFMWVVGIAVTVASVIISIVL